MLYNLGNMNNKIKIIIPLLVQILPVTYLYRHQTSFFLKKLDIMENECLKWFIRVSHIPKVIITTL